MIKSLDERFLNFQSERSNFWEQCWYILLVLLKNKTSKHV